jgi:hypothetical protein
MSTLDLVATPISAQLAHDIAVDAYIYFYPLVMMDVTRLQSTNIEAGKDAMRGPMNAFVHVPAYPPPAAKLVVRPNFDTLYSAAWLDLTREPIVVSAPDTNGRYYLLPMLDMWTDVFASPGSRTTGTTAQRFAVVPPRWTGTLPANVTRIDAPTPYVWIIGRTKTDGPADYDAVHKIQAGYTLTPLSQWGKAPAPPAPVKIDPNVDMVTPPKQQVDTMQGDAFFSYAAELLKKHPPHITDQPTIALLKRIGIEAGKSVQFDELSPVVRQAISDAPRNAQALMAERFPKIAAVINGWQTNFDTVGVYGNYYLKRAIVAQVGLGANLPEDAIYPANFADADGQPLDGANRYKLHFENGQLPPVEAFWSVTLYDHDGFPVPNAFNRSALSSWMPLVANADGSIDLYFQNESPGKEREANWLPAPKGPFNVLIRLYAPKPAVVNGQWVPPRVTKQG